jgi:tetratricopeptide (TPR) repeat protein
MSVMSALWQNFSYPLRGTALGVGLALSLLFSALILVGRNVGVFALYSLPLWLLLSASFLHYCFAVGERAVDGHLDAPPAGFSQLGPFHFRPLLFLLTLGAVFSALQFLVGGLPAALLVAGLTPAIASAFLAHHSLGFQLNPISWLGIILRLGPRYIAMAALLLPACALVVYQPANLLLPVFLFLLLSCVIGLFFGLGRVLYLNRDLLGIEADGSEEDRLQREAARLEAEAFRRRVEDWRSLHRRGHYQDAVDVIRAWLDVNHADIEEWERVFDALLEWQNTNTAARFTPFLVDKLFLLRQDTRALEHYRRIWARHGPLPLSSDDSLYRMARLAKDAGQVEIAARLLKNLPHLFPDSPLVGTARHELHHLEQAAAKPGG